MNIKILLLSWMTVWAIHSAELRDSRPSVLLTSAYSMKSAHRLPVWASKELRITSKAYAEFDAAEWQISIKADINADSTRIENPWSADFAVAFPDQRPVVLHWNKGSHSEPSDFQPNQEELRLNETRIFESFGGRSSDGVMPYFNLADEKGGLIFAIGWTGDWKASFQLNQPGNVEVRAGIKRAAIALKAGEELRLPSVLLMSYQGDWIDGQNKFRRLMRKHFTPGNHPEMTLMPVAASVHGMIGFNDTSEEKLKALAGRLPKSRLPVDTFWLDAGWNEGGFPKAQGNPEADTIRFPHGLKLVGESVKEAGLRFLVWFEPERAMRGTWLEREHSSWLMSPSITPPGLRYQENDHFRLLNLGNIDARNWALENVSRHIQESKIGIYRQDFNLYPSFFWHTNEETNRVGMNEIRHITGLYQFLDGLLLRNPDLILDNCASGGRRLDFEMMRRCVALWRSDSCWDDKQYPRNAQAMSYGLSLWLPLHGLGAASVDTVALRSGMGACSSFAIDFNNAEAVEKLRAHLDLHLKARHLFAADFYPLTPWSLDPSRWLAFQYHDPEKDEGIIQAFHGGSENNAEQIVRLRGLNLQNRYSMKSWDDPSSVSVLSGKELSEIGLRLSIRKKPEALVFQYARERRQ